MALGCRGNLPSLRASSTDLWSTHCPLASPKVVLVSSGHWCPSPVSPAVTDPSVFWGAVVALLHGPPRPEARGSAPPAPRHSHSGPWEFPLLLAARVGAGSQGQDPSCQHCPRLQPLSLPGAAVKVPPTAGRGRKTAEIFSPHSSGSYKTEIKVSWGHFPSRSLREGPSPPPPVPINSSSWRPLA